MTTLDKTHFLYNEFCLDSDLTRLRKIIAHYEMFKMTSNLPGDIIECGVFKGTTLIQFLKFKKILTPNAPKRVIGFDFFDSNLRIDDNHDLTEMKKLYDISNFKGKSIQNIYNTCSEAGFIKDKDIVLVDGDISITLPDFLNKRPGLRISLLHMDLDIEKPTLDVLNSSYERIVKNGIMLFDNYGIDQWTEANAVDAFMKHHPELELKTPINSEYPSAYIIKTY